ncbi:MAG: efflux RND transporter periplasmic adaptor subunit [Desulfovibrionaceae bacterium]|nr:efflux RND transporter periplasmic adaptor subunit [Desulfovibrionaceae bacterium]
MKLYVPFLALFLASTFLLVACQEKKDAQSRPNMAPPVAVHEVKAQDFPWPAEFQAQASGSRAVEVRARVQAIIEKRLYEEGDYVKEGQLLFQLERDQYEAQVQQAQAQYNNAEREWKRVQPLYEKNAVSQKERDNARASYDTSRAALRLAKINLDYCQVVSPVSGYSSKENFTVGNLVSNNSLLTYVNQTDPMHIDFAIAAPERMRRQQLAAEGRLIFPKDGKYNARIRLLDGKMYPGQGSVTFIDSQVQATTGVIKARAVFDNSKGAIMPGQYVRIYMDGDILKDAILIPQQCVTITQKGAIVMGVDKDNVVYPLPIKISESIGKNYLVDAGLKGGERLITEGLIKARPGSKVTITPTLAEQQAAKAKKDAAKANSGK